MRPILEAVRKLGDKGLLEYARKFDHLERKSVRVPVSSWPQPPQRLTPRISIRRRGRFR